LEKIENVFEQIAESKRELSMEVDDLEALKEDITEYQEVVIRSVTSKRFLLTPTLQLWSIRKQFLSSLSILPLWIRNDLCH